MPRLMTPGKPAETRSKLGSSARSLSSPLRTARGVGTLGVGTRWRSLTGLPLRSRSMALRPEPPMSMARVMGPAVGLPGIGFGGLEALRFAGLGVIRRNCTGRQGIGNRESAAAENEKAGNEGTRESVAAENDKAVNWERSCKSAGQQVSESASQRKAGVDVGFCTGGRGGGASPKLKVAPHACLLRNRAAGTSGPDVHLCGGLGTDT